MAVTTEIAWGDGTSDKIYLTRNASEGNQQVLVSSDANTGAARSKVVTFSASGASPVTLTVSQEAGSVSPYPQGYTPVEYLNLPAAAWIAFGDIGYEATDAFEVDLQINTVVAQARITCYNRQNSGCQIYVNGNLHLGYIYNGSWQGLNSVTFDTNRHTVGVDYLNKKVWFDNVKESFTGNSTQNSYNELGIAVKYRTNPQLNAKIYRAKFWRNDVLIHEIVGLRDSDNKPYAYDMVTKSFRQIGGSNPGAVTVGPDVT